MPSVGRSLIGQPCVASTCMHRNLSHISHLLQRQPYQFRSCSTAHQHPNSLPTMSEVHRGTSATPFTDALQIVATELSRRGYDIRHSVPTTLLRAKVGGQTDTRVTGLTARTPDGHAVWTVRFDWDANKQSHVNGSWLIKAGANPGKGEVGEKFYVKQRFANGNAYLDGLNMLERDAQGGDVSALWRGWITRYFTVNEVSGRKEPIVVVPAGTYR
ncbi:hypothetical protein BKA63DRAFT_242874 [Paraphoma chrysanthemicola]|nr:hypothetical protein BKA63DRAFT_242874 [Paraphoma chrysanthemicola]